MFPRYCRARRLYLRIEECTSCGWHWMVAVEPRTNRRAIECPSCHAPTARVVCPRGQHAAD